MTTDLTIEQIEALLHPTTLDDKEIESITGQLIRVMQENEELKKWFRTHRKLMGKKNDEIENLENEITILKTEVESLKREKEGKDV